MDGHGKLVPELLPVDMMFPSKVGTSNLGSLTPEVSEVAGGAEVSLGVANNPLILEAIPDSSISNVECVMDNSFASSMSLDMSSSYKAARSFLKSVTTSWHCIRTERSTEASSTRSRILFRPVCSLQERDLRASGFEETAAIRKDSKSKRGDIVVVSVKNDLFSFNGILTSFFDQVDHAVVNSSSRALSFVSSCRAC